MFFVLVPQSLGRPRSSANTQFGPRRLQVVLQSLQQLCLIFVRKAHFEVFQLFRVRHRDGGLAAGPATAALRRGFGRLRHGLARPLRLLCLPLRFPRPLLGLELRRFLLIARPLLGRPLRLLLLAPRLLGLSSPNSLGLARPLRSHQSPLCFFFLAPNPRCLDPRSHFLPAALGRLWPLCLRPGLALEPLDGG